MKETQRHRDAFEFYFKQGLKRSLRAVAREFHVSVQSLTKWNREFQWQKRVSQREAKIAREVEKQCIYNAARRKMRALSMIDDIYEVNATRLKHMTIEDIADLVTLSRHEQLLVGEATERIDNDYIAEFQTNGDAAHAAVHGGNGSNGNGNGNNGDEAEAQALLTAQEAETSPRF